MRLLQIYQILLLLYPLHVDLMNQRRGQISGIQPIAGYAVNRNGGLAPIIDLDAKVEIDLTGTDDEDEIVFTGMRWDSGMNKRQQRVPEGERRRDKEQERQKRAQGSAGRSTSTSNARTPADVGPSSRASTIPFSRSFACVFRTFLVNQCD